MVSNTNVLIADVSNGTGWSFWFRRNFFDWEMQEVEFFLQKMLSVKINQGKEDALCWNLNVNKNGMVTVNSYYKELIKSVRRQRQCGLGS